MDNYIMLLMAFLDKVNQMENSRFTVYWRVFCC